MLWSYLKLRRSKYKGTTLCALGLAFGEVWWPTIQDFNTKNAYHIGRRIMPNFIKKKKQKSFDQETRASELKKKKNKTKQELSNGQLAILCQDV